jgi:hypothetical protein
MHVVHVVVMMVMVVMVMMVHRLGHRSGSSGRSVLRHCIAGEAERENGRGGKGLDHGKGFLWFANPNGSGQAIETSA